MRWLQWSEKDLERGLGGVEVYSRSLARELRGRGIDCRISSNRTDLDQKWDVVITHGDCPAPCRPVGAIVVHVLHGSTFGRMWSCREWAWPGGYLAGFRETWGVVQSDIVITVNPDLGLFKLAAKLGKKAIYSGAGWDSADPNAGQDCNTLSGELLRQLEGNNCWLFVGRGDDPVKGADRIIGVLQQDRTIRLVAAPGSGFEQLPGVVKTGSLDPIQVRTLMNHARGLLVSSRYESFGLVCVEALASGLPVVSTRVGFAEFHREPVAGLCVLKSHSTADFLEVLRMVEEMFPVDPVSRSTRAESNRRVLLRWSDVAEKFIRSVEELSSTM